MMLFDRLKMTRFQVDAATARERHRPCVHSWCETSTLRTVEVSAVGKPMYIVFCKECGIATEMCFTPEEAHARAESGWMK